MCPFTNGDVHLNANKHDQWTRACNGNVSVLVSKHRRPHMVSLPEVKNNIPAFWGYNDIDREDGAIALEEIWIFLEREEDIDADDVLWLVALLCFDVDAWIIQWCSTDPGLSVILDSDWETVMEISAPPSW